MVTTIVAATLVILINNEIGAWFFCILLGFDFSFIQTSL